MPGSAGYLDKAVDGACAWRPVPPAASSKTRADAGPSPETVIGAAMRPMVAARRPSPSELTRPTSTSPCARVAGAGERAVEGPACWRRRGHADREPRPLRLVADAAHRGERSARARSCRGAAAAACAVEQAADDRLHPPASAGDHLEEGAVALGLVPQEGEHVAAVDARPAPAITDHAREHSAQRASVARHPSPRRRSRRRGAGAAAIAAR